MATVQQAVLESCIYQVKPWTAATITVFIHHHTKRPQEPYQHQLLPTYHLNVTTYVFNPVGDWIPAAVYRHNVTEDGITNYQGAFYAMGLTRTPDIRLTALGLLAEYTPRLYRSEYTAYGTSRLVVLQLGLVGGV